MDLRCDNETRTGFRKEDSQASAFLQTTAEGSRILDSGFRDLSRASSTRFVILDSGFSGGKSRLSSFELKSQLSPCTARTDVFRILALGSCLALSDFDVKGTPGEVWREGWR